MAKVLPSEWTDGKDGKEYIFLCPACGNGHFFRTNASEGPSWTWNGDVEKPTVTPSIKVRGGGKGSDHVCHFHLTDGMIVYCGDCTHAMANRAVPLPDFEEPDDGQARATEPTDRPAQGP